MTSPGGYTERQVGFCCFPPTGIKHVQVVLAPSATDSRKDGPPMDYTSTGGDTERQVGGPGSSTRQVAVQIGLAPPARKGHTYITIFKERG